MNGWQQQAFWMNRQTDDVARAQPPLKHLYQNVFNMTFWESCRWLNWNDPASRPFCPQVTYCRKPPCVEAYPALVAKRIGVDGSCKRQPEQCIEKGIARLAGQGVTMIWPDCLKAACITYQTAEGDYEAADAFLCLVTSICVVEGLSEMLIADARPAIQKQESGIVVPRVGEH